ncbi:hypothetical protein MVEG_06278 [Podila verticillata NRRL 6337]|nr:hypothetical protein MVEG_06278 [Podila verticillata NRRL 6337]
MTDNPYPVGTTVFAKLKGYPWWPARIENESDLPPNVSSKKPKQRPIWPVFFYGSYDYGWFGTSELKAFDPVSAERAKSSMKKGSGLRTALSEALDPSLIAMASASAVNEYDEDEDDEEEEVFAAKKPSKAKARTKSKDASDSEQPNGKKRRPSAETAKSKPTKRSVHDDEEEEDSPKPKKRASIIGRSRLESDTKSVDDENMTEGHGRTKSTEEEGGESGDPNRTKKKIRSGQPNERLLKLRHKLQKLLLVEGLSDEVLVQNLERSDPIMTEVEAFDINLQMLKDTKIGRLMKKISVLQYSQDRFQIVERSVKLIKQYKAMMEKAQENGEGVGASDHAAGSSPGAVNASGETHHMDIAPVPESVIAAVVATVGSSPLEQPVTTMDTSV